MRITAYMLSCPERALVRRETQERLESTDWAVPAQVVLDPGRHTRPQERQSENARALLRRAIEDAPDFLLFLEDDLEFNRYLRSNLAAWEPLAVARRDEHFFGALYNPGVRELRREPSRSFFVADPDSVYGSQAFVLALATARYIEACWEDVAGMQDIKMSRLAGRVGPIHYHEPSLVQHVPVPSVWGGGYHRAIDYLPDWTAAPPTDPIVARPAGRIDRDAILRRMRQVDGWLEDEEASLLITAISEALDRFRHVPDAACVEVGSSSGRSTVVLGLAIKAFGSTTMRLYAIDEHEGDVSTLEQGVARTGPTLEAFSRAVREAGLDDITVPLVARAPDVPWHRRIAMLFVDGLHDYASVAADFGHFHEHVCRGGFVAFHDYAFYFPGVSRVVDELLAGGAYRLAHQARSLVVLEKR